MSGEVLFNCKSLCDMSLFNFIAVDERRAALALSPVMSGGDRVGHRQDTESHQHFTAQNGLQKK